MPEIGFKLALTMVDGIPKRAIQPLRKACATTSAVVEVRGITSGHLVNLSTHVSRYVKPRDRGSGPTKSMWIVSKRDILRYPEVYVFGRS